MRSPSPPVDITRDPANAARLVLEYAPGTPPGEYQVRFDRGDTAFAPGLYGPHLLFGDVTDVGLIRLVPEPASLSVLAACALLALRRRPKH